MDQPSQKFSKGLPQLHSWDEKTTVPQVGEGGTLLRGTDESSKTNRKLKLLSLKGEVERIIEAGKLLLSFGVTSCVIGKS